jgi:hypothetical protein
MGGKGQRGNGDGGESGGRRGSVPLPGWEMRFEVERRKVGWGDGGKRKWKRKWERKRGVKPRT